MLRTRPSPALSSFLTQVPVLIPSQSVQSPTHSQASSPHTLSRVCGRPPCHPRRLLPQTSSGCSPGSLTPEAEGEGRALPSPLRSSHHCLPGRLVSPADQLSPSGFPPLQRLWTSVLKLWVPLSAAVCLPLYLGCSDTSLPGFDFTSWPPHGVCSIGATIHCAQLYSRY